MIKIEYAHVDGWVSAIRGMRNPMNSWEQSDSGVGCDNGLCGSCGFNNNWCGCSGEYKIGEKDFVLMKRLVKAGSDHSKFMRMITVTCDITAPLYWWKEFDTYKVGTVRNSCSTMHKIHAKEFELDDFSHEHIFGDFKSIEKKSATDYEVIFNTNKILLKSDTLLMCLIEVLNYYREKYLETKDKDWWWQLIQLLPSSYNQKRTITMNYENIITMIRQRTGHKLDEWNEFISVLENLPYIKEIMHEI